MSVVVKQFPFGALYLEGDADHTRDVGQVSDGYHTFDELYDHRIALFIALCESETTLHAVLNERDRTNLPHRVWRSLLHSDGSKLEGWFVMGIGKRAGDQITYHLPLSCWDRTGFAETLERGPEFDGHTSADVLVRLRNL